MASLHRYICKTCNTDLGSDGATVESHLANNLTHSVRSVLFDESEVTSSIEGQTRVYNGELFTYDDSRGKWLSNRRLSVGWGMPSTYQRNIYLRLWGFMSAASADAGFMVYRNATITKMIVTASATATVNSTAMIRYYGGATLASLSFTSSLTVVQDLSLNVDVGAGNNLFSYLSGQNSNASRSYPQIIAELAWRI